jgi:hypothetical protein
MRRRGVEGFMLASDVTGPVSEMREREGLENSICEDSDCAKGCCGVTFSSLEGWGTSCSETALVLAVMDDAAAVFTALAW